MGRVLTRRAGEGTLAGPYHVRMPPADWTLVALCASAFLAGAMNSIAGGGTLLTFPALFTAFAPLKDPQVAVCVLLVGQGAGGATAAPAAKTVIEAALKN